jgi:predicted permease
MSGLLQDLRYSLRSLRNAPGFTLIAIGIIAIGIGASSTIFSWVRSVLLNPLPGAAQPQNVVALESVGPNGGWYATSYLDFRDLRDNCKLIEAMSVAKPMALPVDNADGETVERVWGEVVSGNFFDLLGVHPEAGRFFSSAEVDHEQNAHPLLVISHSYWTSHYNADPHVIGSTIRIGHFPYTVIGVTPPGFHGSMPGLNLEMWAPATMFGQLSATGTQTLVDRKWRTFRVLARLAPGVSFEQARLEVESVARLMARLDADTNAGMSATLLPLWKSHYGVQDSLRSPLGVLMAACILVLLIVCANVANLLLVRATARQKEFSIRLALGAPRMRLMRQMLMDSLLVAGAGSVVGLTIAMWLSGSLSYLLPRSSSPMLEPAPIDAGVILFAIALAVVVSVLAGIAPALRAASGNVNEMLKEGGRSASSSGRSSRLSGLFVTAEMALAVVAVIGAGLFLASFRHVSEIRTGFESSHVAIAQLDLSAGNYNASQAASFYQRYTASLERQPGITAVAYSDYAPLSVSSGSWEDLQIQGFVPAPGENMKIYRSLISPGYFNLLKIPLLAGRDFNALDNASAPPVMIVNQEFVRRFVPGGMAIGRKVQGWGRWFTIVGVVQDTKIYRLTETPTPYFYVPMTQIYRPEMGLVFFARTSGSMDSAITALRREAQAADPVVPVFDASSLDDFISASLFPQKIASSLLSVLGTVALFLAAVGLYGVMAYSVAQRTNEIGIRMALGAQPMHVARLVIQQGMFYALIGLVAGSFAAAALARLASSALTGISAWAPAIYAMAAAVTILLALASIALPAWRAVSVDPLTALRHE